MFWLLDRMLYGAYVGFLQGIPGFKCLLFIKARKEAAIYVSKDTSI
jgi:hypothetical protein